MNIDVIVIEDWKPKFIMRDREYNIDKHIILRNKIEKELAEQNKREREDEVRDRKSEKKLIKLHHCKEN